MRYTRISSSPPPGGLMVRLPHGPVRPSVLHAELDNSSNRRGRHREHSHGVYHAVYCTRGSTFISLGGRRTAFSAGDLVLTSPGTPHDFALLSDGAYAEVTFELLGARGSLVDAPFASLLGALAGFEPPPSAAHQLRLSAPRGRELMGLFAALTESLLRNPDGPRSQIAFFEALAFISEEVARTGPAAGSSGNPAVARARDEIDRRYREPLSITGLASRLGVSAPHLIRAFKAEVGLPPKAYQMMLRIGAAKTLLASTGLFCKEVASMAGFGDVYVFSRAFKRLEGVSPTEFRRRRVRGSIKRKPANVD